VAEHFGVAKLKFDIKRGGLFESSALDYDQFRPGYPSAIISEVVSLSSLRSSSRLLEIGCGTGKATVCFAPRGYMIDCVDPGKKLVGFARRNCRAWPQVNFQIGKFEDVVFEANSFDLIYSAQAFHWVDPEIRMKKVARLLKPGGSFALLQNFPGKEVDPTIEIISAAVQKESDGKMKPWDYFENLAKLKDEIESAGIFDEASIVRHRWTQQFSAESYAGLFRTYSDFLSLPKSVQRRIALKMREIINGNGGRVTRSYDSILIHAKKWEKKEGAASAPNHSESLHVAGRAKRH
jgi:SAM-dependent methyltransferase